MTTPVPRNVTSDGGAGQPGTDRGCHIGGRRAIRDLERVPVRQANLQKCSPRTGTDHPDPAATPDRPEAAPGATSLVNPRPGPTLPACRTLEASMSGASWFLVPLAHTTSYVDVPGGFPNLDFGKGVTPSLIYHISRVGQGVKARFAPRAPPQAAGFHRAGARKSRALEAPGRPLHSDASEQGRRRFRLEDAM